MAEEVRKFDEWIDTDKPIPYSNNPKTHPEEQIDDIAASIDEFGFVQPLVLDSDNKIVIGHGRLKAAKKLDLDEVPIVRADHLSEAEIKKLRIADNKVAESEWDHEKLMVEFEEMQEKGFDADGTGFSEDEREEIIDRFEQPDDEDWANHFEDENSEEGDDEKDLKHVTFVLEESDHEKLMDKLDQYEGDKNESFRKWINGE